MEATLALNRSKGFSPDSQLILDSRYSGLFMIDAIMNELFQLVLRYFEGILVVEDPLIRLFCLS